MRIQAVLGTALLAFGLGSCSGGGGSGASSSSAQFALQDIGVSSGQIWQINRPIAFTFTQPVDFSTVNMNTINVAQINGAPAIGSFLLDSQDPRKVYFLPTCPTLADLSDAGLKPGGVAYRILVAGSDSSAVTVRATNGNSLVAGQTLVFQTPSSTILTQLFLDPVTGPPSILTRQAPGQVGTRLVIGGDTANPVYFVRNEFGVGLLENGMEVPLNLYSRPETRVAIYLEFNQPINPSAENVSPSRLRLQYDANPDPAVQAWTPISTQIDLVANCTTSGSTVRLTPIGVLPQDRDLRVFISAEFEDLVGDRNILPLADFARMTSDYFRDGLGFPLPFTDEIRETFLVGGVQPGSIQDANVVFDGPPANWNGGSLSAAFGFSGSGGPGGNFDFHIPPNTDFIFDTSATLVTGGPGGLPVAQQLVIGGRLDVRNLFIPSSSTLRIQGPNPALILASGTVTIQGSIAVNGNPGRSVFTVNTPTLPEGGASGQAGGGRGGTGSYITTGPTPRGGAGFGAFNVEGQGGEGGESGYGTNGGTNGANRKVAGGGGGVFGHDQMLTASCPDQGLIGLDAEDGFPGALTVFSAPRAAPMPWGGRFGPKPFLNPTDSAADRVDDFYGVKIADVGTGNARLVVGELPKPWAGAGGGAGGDAIISDTYPPPSFQFNQHNKGAGAGGGGGSLHIQALGSIIFGNSGRILARGGAGGRGESVNWSWSVGGGSGGGSGGHIILQTANLLDMSALTPGIPAITARGGQGGAGPNNQGGAWENGETLSSQDSVHSGDQAGTNQDNPFSPNGCPTTQPFVRTAGGDGGPGIIQFHVSSLSNIRYPGNQINNLGNLCKPVPHGYTWNGTTGSWKDHLLPEFGSISRAQSKWIPLGEVTVAPGTVVPDSIAFSFQGTNPANGEIQTTGQYVTALPPILAPAGTIEDGGLPNLQSGDPRTLLLSGADLAPGNAFYRQNPNLLIGFGLEVDQGGGAVTSLLVESAAYDSFSDVFALSVASNLPTAGTVRVRPKFFQVYTANEDSLLPNTAKIQIQFQAAPASATGQPNESAVFPAAGQWANDISALTNAPGGVNSSFRFLRFRVSFDIGSNLSFDTPRPALDFLRIPFRF